MSQIKATAIEGDVAVGRHVTAGGNAKIQGNAVVKKNLKVEGWLEAPNIRGFLKGLLPSLEAVEAKYPKPHDGWVALVGTSLPAHVYMCIDKEWVAQYNEDGTPRMGGETDVNLTDIEDHLNEHDSKHDHYDDTLAEINTDLNALTTDLNTLATALNSKAPLGSDGKVPAEYLPEAVVAAGVAAQSVGQPSGIAPLGDDGRVPAEYLPEAVVAAAGDCRVCAFAGAVDDVELQEGEATYKSTDNLCAVVYDTVKARLLLRRLVHKHVIPPLSSEEERGTSEEAQAVSPMSLGGLEGGEVVLPLEPDPANPDPINPSNFDTYYYARWGDDASFGSPSASGCKPVKGRAYVDTSEATIWLWDGSALKAAAGGEVERITEDEIDQFFEF